MCNCAIECHHDMDNDACWECHEHVSDCSCSCLDEVHTLGQSLNTFTIVWGVVASLCLAATVAVTVSSPKEPRLVGIGCLGVNGNLYADEEDDFPTTCTDIRER